MKTTVIFKDAKGNKVVFNAEITERNGYPEFTASGEYCGGLGQVFDHVEPATESQAKLIELWHKWHLNGLNSGTVKQSEIAKGLNYDEALKALTAIDRETGKESFFHYRPLVDEIDVWKREIKIIDDWFIKASVSANDLERGIYYTDKRALYTRNLTDAEEALKSTLLYDIDPREGANPHSLYKYGSAWLVRPLPEDFEDTLTELIETIEREEEEKAERLVTAEDIDLFNDFTESETALALALMMGLNINEIEDITEDGNNYWTVQGVSYLAGTDEEMDQAWDESLDSYIDECMEIPEHIERYFDRDAYKEDAKMDGRGHSLNHWNGGEEEIKINNTWYFAYRQ
jgi:hypothetical protein